MFSNLLLNKKCKFRRKVFRACSKKKTVDELVEFGAGLELVYFTSFRFGIYIYNLIFLPLSKANVARVAARVFGQERSAEKPFYRKGNNWCKLLVENGMKHALGILKFKSLKNIHINGQTLPELAVNFHESGVPVLS